jgi:hypothetical protein
MNHIKTKNDEAWLKRIAEIKEQYGECSIRMSDIVVFEDPLQQVRYKAMCDSYLPKEIEDNFELANVDGKVVMRKKEEFSTDDWKEYDKWLDEVERESNE